MARPLCALIFAGRATCVQGTQMTSRHLALLLLLHLGLYQLGQGVYLPWLAALLWWVQPFHDQEHVAIVCVQLCRCIMTCALYRSAPHQVHPWPLIGLHRLKSRICCTLALCTQVIICAERHVALLFFCSNRCCHFTVHAGLLLYVIHIL